MEIYIIICISFAILYHIRYITDILFIVEEVARIHDVESTQIPKIAFIITSFVLSALFMPIAAPILLFSNREEFIKDGASKLLLRYCDLELKK